MRLYGLTAVVAVLASFPPLSTGAPAQQPIRVLHHAPAQTARSGDVITVTFDRPIMEAMERLPDPKTLVRIDPPLAATIQWRDPVTLRVIPAGLIPPARRYTFTIDTTFAAEDGGRLAAPYRFTLATRGPRLLGHLPSLGNAVPKIFQPTGKITLLYSAPVDTAELSRVARLEILSSPPCAPRTIRFRVTSDRPLGQSDVAAIRAGTTWNSDTDPLFRRVVALESEAPLPDGCSASWVIPSFDPDDRSELRYRAATMPPFRVDSLRCVGEECAMATGLSVAFNAPVKRERLVASMRVEPRVPFTIDTFTAARSQWLIRLAVKPRTTYRVRFDSAFADEYGRHIAAPRELSVVVRDRRPALGHQLGFFTLPRGRPALRITHVNADSADLAIIPVPDSLRTRVVAAATWDSVARLIGSLRDTIHHKVALSARLNEEHVTDVPIPTTLIDRYPGTLFAIRARGMWRVAPSYGEKRLGELTEVIVLSERYALSNYVALVQITDLVAHAKVDAARGAVFVTDINTGRAVTGAIVSLRDLDGAATASGVTNAAGVADLQPSPNWRPPVRPPREDRYQYAFGYGFGWRYYPRETRVVEVVHGADRSATVIAPYRYGYPYAYSYAYDDPRRNFPTGDEWYDRDRYVRATAYSERPIYRPGEKVYLGAIVRQGWLGELKLPPAGDSVRVRVESTDDRWLGIQTEIVRDTVLRLSTYGTVADSFSLRRVATLGYYVVRVDAVIDGGWRTAAWTGFRVAEYRAPEFRAAVTLDTVARFLGDSVRGHVDASYYFGAPMAGATVNWSAITTPLDDASKIPGLPRGFGIGHRPYDGPGPASERSWQSGVDTLDATGRLTLAIPTTPGTLSGPGEVEVDVMVDDLNRQSVSANARTLIHGSSYYVAVRDSGRAWYWKENVPRGLEVIAVRPDGRRVSGVRAAIAVVRYQHVWSYASGAGYPTTSWVTDTILRDSIVTSDSIVRFAYTPRSQGSHLVVFTIRDDQGRTAKTSIGRYVVASGAVASWGSNPTSLTMRVTPDTVSVGDSARVSIVSPFARAEAWLTVEREGVLLHRRATVRRGETTIAFPVDDRFTPGVMVSVVLVDSAQAWRTDSVHHRLRVGQAALVVDRSNRGVVVEIAPAKPKYEPGDSARITVRLRDRRGRPVSGEVALWAVDESVIALTDYTPPDPLAGMYALRGSAFSFGTTAAALASHARQLVPPGWRLEIYGTAALNALAMSAASAAGATNATVTAARTNFRTTPFFWTGLVVDSAGEVTRTVKLPDNLTTYRVVAVAATKDARFGSTEATLLVTKPLLARTALPRFVRTGDALLAGAVLTNQTAQPVPVRVQATGRSVVLDGRRAGEDTLGVGASAEVRFGWRANAAPGDTAAFRFDVAGRGPSALADAVEISLPVRAPYSPSYHLLTGVARGSETVRMLLPRGLDPARSRLTVRVGTTPVPVVQAAYRRMDAYPYYCTEQLTSVGDVVVAMLRMQRAGVVDSTVMPRPPELRRKLQWIVDELTRRQTPEGGIGYWASSDWTSARLTAGTGLLLVSARDLGVEVSDRVLERLTVYLREPPNQPSLMLDTAYGTRRNRSRALATHLADRLARVHYLRIANMPDTSAESALLGVEQEMYWEDRVLLADVLSRRPDQSAARELLARTWRAVDVIGARVEVPDSLLRSDWFPSQVRPLARLLRATLALEPEHRALGPLIGSVVRQGRSSVGRSWNTQDYAAASAALVELSAWQRSTVNAGPVLVRSARRGQRVLMSGLPVPRADSAISLAGLVERDGDWLVLPVRMEGSGGAIFYSLSVTEVPLEPPTTPEAKGVIVERWYERFDDGRPVRSVKEGELVRGRLRITVPSMREFVAVEDLLPAGLEVVDLSLRTSSTLGPLESDASRAAKRAGDVANRGASRYGAWYGPWWSPWEHRELRDDRVLYFARQLDKGSYTATYVARATTAGTFIRPPAHAEEMYNPSLGGRSDGGTFVVTPKE